MDGELTAREILLNMESTEIQELIAAPSRPKGVRNDSVLKAMNAAASSGWSNHQILALGSELAQRWGASDPERNLFDHWSRLLRALGNVRRHYPAGAQYQP